LADVITWSFEMANGNSHCRIMIDSVPSVSRLRDEVLRT